jgi:hypothetical protein
MARLPVPGGDNNVWGDVLNTYLLREHKVDGTHDGAALMAVPEVAAALAAKQDKVGGVFSVAVPVMNPAAGAFVAWRAPFAAQLIGLQAYRVGGSGATVNARKNGTANHLAVDLSVSVAGAWVDGGLPQNNSYAIGDTLEIVITAVSGAPAQLIVQLDFVTG